MTFKKVNPALKDILPVQVLSNLLKIPLGADNETDMT